VPDKPGIAARLFKGIADAGIVVDIIVQNVSSDGKAADISFTVPKTDAKKALKLTEGIAKELAAKGVDMKEDIAKISIVGVGMRTHSGVASQIFETLCEYNDDKHVGDKGILRYRHQIYGACSAGFT
jgi:aspartate kinase